MYPRVPVEVGLCADAVAIGVELEGSVQFELTLMKLSIRMVAVG